MGNFEEPFKIHAFVGNVFAGFSMVSILFFLAENSDLRLIQLNLKNDSLRKRFDGLKYDLKKIEEGMSGLLESSSSHPNPSCVWSVSAQAWTVEASIAMNVHVV